MRKLTSLAVVVALAFSYPLFPTRAFAAGAGAFENPTFTAQSIGEANAVVARADEAGAVAYNPAGTAYLRGIQASTDVSFLSLFTRTKQSGSVHYDGGTLIPVPTGYMTVNSGKLLNERLTLGIGSDSPFGLVTRYDSNLSSVHYTGYTNKIKMYAIRPTAALKLHEKFSVGGGPVMYRIFDLEQVSAYPNALGVAGLPDGQMRVTGKALNWGWQLGSLLKLHPKHQFGAYFRSPVTMHAKGKVQVERSSFHPNGQFETDARAKIDLPLDITVGYAFLPTEKTSIETDFTYSRWSAFKRLVVAQDRVTNPASAVDDAILNAILPQSKDYRDNYVIHLGGRHKMTDKLTLRGGGYFSFSPIPNKSFIPAVADSNSIALTTGFSYQFAKYMQLDFAYLVRYWFQRTVNNDISEVLGTTVDGKYSSFLQEFTIGFTYKFDDIWGSREKTMSSDTSEGAYRMPRMSTDKSEGDANTVTYSTPVPAPPARTNSRTLAPVPSAAPKRVVAPQPELDSTDELLEAMKADLEKVVK